MNNGAYHTDHFLDRMIEREIPEIAIQYTLKHGIKRVGNNTATYLLVLTTKKIHDLIFETNMTRDDMMALTIVESRGGLTIVLGKKGGLITTYCKNDKRKRSCKSKQDKTRTGNYPILPCIKELESSQPIKITGLSRRKINQAYQCLKYRYTEVN